MASYPEFRTFNYGNVLANVENIKNSRARRDPNSLDNQYKQSQINALTTANDPNSLDNQYKQSQIDLNKWKTEGESNNNASANTEILANGTTVFALPNQEVKVIAASGAEITDPVLKQKAFTEAAQFRQTRLQEESERKIAQDKTIEQNKLTAKRVMEMRQAYGDRGRDAARSQVKLRQALTLAASATQGTEGVIKLRLGKLLNIDVSDEGALDAALKDLTMTELARFKGPTTDFEYGVAESITGKLGDSKTANIARLNSLERARWFSAREAKQFDKHMKTSNDPEAFRFNFDETIKTKKGEYSLRLLQDTAVANNLSIDDVLKRLNQ